MRSFERVQEGLFNDIDRMGLILCRGLAIRYSRCSRVCIHRPGGRQAYSGLITFLIVGQTSHS